MTKNTWTRGALLSATLALAACDGGGGPNGLSCRSLSSVVDDAMTSGTCTTTCRSSNVRAAADGDLGSAAILTLDAGGTSSVGARVRASGGGEFAAGTQVGVIFEASAASQTNVRYELNTYLNGAMVESFSLGSDGTGSRARGPSHSVSTTQLPYDSVEFLYRRSAGTTEGTATVYELCSD